MTVTCGTRRVPSEILLLGVGGREEVREVTAPRGR